MDSSRVLFRIIYIYMNDRRVNILLFLLPSTDNVQHDLQHGSLITFPKEENLGNKKKRMHQLYLPSVPTFSLSTIFFLLYLLLPSHYVLSLNPKLHILSGGFLMVRVGRLIVVCGIYALAVQYHSGARSILEIENISPLPCFAGRHRAVRLPRCCLSRCLVYFANLSSRVHLMRLLGVSRRSFLVPACEFRDDLVFFN